MKVVQDSAMVLSNYMFNFLIFLNISPNYADPSVPVFSILLQQPNIQMNGCIPDTRIKWWEHDQNQDRKFKKALANVNFD